MAVSNRLLGEIKRRAKKIELTDKDIYLSAAYKEYANALVFGLLGKQAEYVNVEISCDPHSEVTAFTSGELIFLNTANSLVRHFATEEGRFLANLGLIFHECAHILYSDFEVVNQANKVFSAGAFYPEIPAGDAVDTDVLDDMIQAMQDKRIAKLVASAASTIENCVADAHDEMCICAAHGDLVKQGIQATTIALQATATALEDMIEGGQSPLSIMYALILDYARFYKIIALDDDSAWNTEYGKKLSEMKRIIYDARFTDDSLERFLFINQILVQLWPYIKAELTQQDQGDGKGKPQPGQGDSNSASSQGGGSGFDQSGSDSGQPNSSSQGQGSGNGKISNAAIQRVSDQLTQGANSAGMQNSAPQPEHRKSAKMPPPDPSQKHGNGADGSQFDQNAAEAALNSLINTLSQREAEKEVEEKERIWLSQEISEIKVSDVHRNRELAVYRDLYVTELMRTDYESYYQEVALYSKVLQRKMTQLLKNLNDDGLVRRQYGTVMKPQEAYRRDKKFFFKKKRPEDLPNMAVAILMDQSGSMSGDRIDTCIKTAILLEDFAAGLNIPIMVAGHNVWGGDANLYVHVPFEEASRSDKYRIVNASASGCNRDGLPLSVVEQMLEKRTEDVKMLFIISDGKPNDDGYSGTIAKQDLQSICRRAEKKGILLYAAGIGDDSAELHDIYGKRFLDVTDLSLLPKTLITLVRKNLFK